MYKNSSPEKWIYKEHTKVKHILLKKYLYAWIPILGRWNPIICYFDGFAGRGEYKDEKTGEVLNVGSPILALKVADKKAEYLDKIVCVFVESDIENYENLEEAIEREKPNMKNLKKIKIIMENAEFARVCDKILERLEEEKCTLVPSFFFVDPFGFNGIPFTIIKKILSNPKTEIFFNFMARDIARFIKLPQLEDNFTELFGTEEWKSLMTLHNREQAVVELYRKQLHEDAGVTYSLHFKVSESDKLRTLYYLIHATNNFKGHGIMKGIMFNQSAHGSFAYLGPNDVSERSQIRLFDINDTGQLKRYLDKRFKGETLTFNGILERVCIPWYSEPPYIEKHYRQALKKFEEKGKIGVERVTSKTEKGLSGEDKITFLKSNPLQIKPPISTQKSVRKVKLYYKEYQQFDGRKEMLVQRVNDGSIITRFDKTPFPKSRESIICPHFLELKWAYGCPYDCAWCYLKGTFRFRPEGPSPVVKPYEKIELHTRKFLEEVKTPEILNTGEIADSLMHENVEMPFTKFIASIFETQKIHKILFLTKSSFVKNLLENDFHKQAIVSFSLNALPVAERWEKAPSVLRRVKALKEVFEAGYEVRIRIDPIVPVENWKEHYLQLLGIIFENVIPERITLGSLRGLQSTINGCSDRSWVKYLKEPSNWGKRIDFKTRYEVYSTLIQQLRAKYNFDTIALCKETVQMWDALEMDYHKIWCNCIW